MDTPWRAFEAGFNSFDQTRLFYRGWQPVSKKGQHKHQALIFLHRGHEHSGRIEPLVQQLGFEHHWAFAWDARGHGYSPGERGCAADFATLVRDLDCFVRHIRDHYQIDIEDMLLVANSVGAVIAATWLLDYAPPVRGVVMAAAAFSIKLYVPFAESLLRLGLCFKPDMTVSSYIRPSMLTHDVQQAQAYAQDALISPTISARLLVDLAQTARRVVANAGAIYTPVCMLVAEQDYVVRLDTQQHFYQRLSSDFKQWHRIEGAYHAVLYEQDANKTLALARRFIEKCYSRTEIWPPHLVHADQQGYSALQYQALLHNYASHPVYECMYRMQRGVMRHLGACSEGIRLGLQYGFDSGTSLDYVYRNQAQGRFVVGRWLDRGYLNAIGWQGIRQRRVHLQQALQLVLEGHQGVTPLRMLDIAAGSARYLLETLKRYPDAPVQLTLRDYQAENLSRAQALAQSLALPHQIDYQQADAFDPDSYQEQEAYDVVLVSGLYELVAENAPVLTSLQGIAQLLKPGGYLIYTAQTWHPQLAMIAKTLNDHQGKSWVMRPRSQAEMDALVRSIGGEKVHSWMGIQGIFSVSLAQLPAHEEILSVDEVTHG